MTPKVISLGTIESVEKIVGCVATHHHKPATCALLQCITVMMVRCNAPYCLLKTSP